MLAATARLERTMMGESRLGTICRKRVLDPPAPSDFAACTNSSSLILSISPLAIKAKRGHPNNPRVSTIRERASPCASRKRNIFAKSKMITRTGRTKKI